MSPGSEDWHNGNAYTGFAELMALRKLDESTYESESPAYSPGGFTRAYGGHVYAQSACAAARTVRKGFVLHSITGWFTEQGVTNKPFTYRVSTLREGRGYCQRQISVFQRSSGPEKTCFFAIASFKKQEENNNPHSLTLSLDHAYAPLCPSAKDPETGRECPGIDSPFWQKIEAERGWTDPFPGLKMRKVDMQLFNEGKPVLEKRQLLWYSVLGAMPAASEDPNLHAAAHLYASDRNGLFPVANYVGRGDNYLALASLSHTVVFHGDLQDTSTMQDEDGVKAKWFLSEERVENMGHGRALVTWRLWGKDGRHVASCWQDGMVRFPREGAVAGAATAFIGPGAEEERKAKL